MLFQLYKKRGFSDYLNDSFAFLKLVLKHYAKNYFIICGIFLLIVTVLSYILGNAYMSFIQGSINDNFSVEKIFGGNLILFGIVLLLFVVIFLIFSFISYLFPVIYLRLIDQNQSTNFGSNELFEELKSNIGRTVLFSIFSFLFMMTIGLVIFAILILLLFTIIGIPVTVIGFLALIAIFNLGFYVYINDSSLGYFEALKISFFHIKANLWPIIGANFAMYMVVNLISTAITLIPSLVAMGSIFTTIESGENSDFNSTSSLIFGGIMSLSIILSFLFQNLLLINNGMIYYTMQENSESVHVKSEIDLIGTDSAI